MTPGERAADAAREEAEADAARAETEKQRARADARKRRSAWRQRARRSASARERPSRAGPRERPWRHRLWNARAVRGGHGSTSRRAHASYSESAREQARAAPRARTGPRRRRRGSLAQAPLRRSRLRRVFADSTPRCGIAGVGGGGCAAQRGISARSRRRRGGQFRLVACEVGRLVGRLDRGFLLMATVARSASHSADFEPRPLSVTKRRSRRASSSRRRSGRRPVQSTRAASRLQPRVSLRNPAAFPQREGVRFRRRVPVRARRRGGVRRGSAGSVGPRDRSTRRRLFAPARAKPRPSLSSAREGRGPTRPALPVLDAERDVHAR